MTTPIVTINFPTAVASDDTRGPKSVTLTLNSSAQILAAPAVGQSIYITALMASNTSGTNVRVDLLEGSTVRISQMLAANGGGFVLPFYPPWKLPAATAFNGQLSSSVTDVRVNVHYTVSA